MKRCLQIIVGFVGYAVFGFSATARSALSRAFSSPSGKLTYLPEVVIPEPKDATALLLFTNTVQTLSERLRSCQANAVFLDGGLTAVTTFCNEQAESSGNFPGPVPVLYCGSETDYAAIRETGVVGMLVDCSLENDEWVGACQSILEAGMEPIPELTLQEQESWEDDTVEKLLDKVKNALGTTPVAVVVTINPISNDSNEEEEAGREPVSIPAVPKTLSKEIPVLGSIRVLAGENRLGMETVRFKEAGYTGAFLRSDCVPGFRLQPHMEIVSSFWQAVVSDLKSTKSKRFSFRSKNNMNVSAGEKWAKYQKGVLDSGALGAPEDSYSVVNEAAGEYKGFA